MPPTLPAEARAAVLAWYDARGRDLAFRASRDPYAILVSEVMAQQTQVSRVIEAWPRFLARFPTVDALAAASPADVLRAWQGMGYDRRALNLRRAAQVIRDQHAGEVPSEIAALEKLPGIGPYTARAVAAIAFGAAVGAVDTNVRRVLGRALVDGRSGVAATWIQHAADAAVDPARPGDWTHALMDIGATVCRPRRPFCDVCPLQRWCATAGEEGRAREVAQRATRSDVRRAAFPTTRRWLRGRIVDRLRSAEGAAWTRIDGPIGTHDPAAVAETLLALAADGVVEQDPARSSYVRLATA